MKISKNTFLIFLSLFFHENYLSEQKSNATETLNSLARKYSSHLGFFVQKMYSASSNEGKELTKIIEIIKKNTFKDDDSEEKVAEKIQSIKAALKVGTAYPTINNKNNFYFSTILQKHGWILNFQTNEITSLKKNLDWE